MVSLGKEIIEINQLFKSLLKEEEKLTKFKNIFIKALENDKKILFCGNGGSAADSIHFASELVGRFNLDRKSLFAISLATDIASLTSISNDFGFKNVFSRQLEGIGRAGDILFSISTSGKSENVNRAVKLANELDLITLSLSGKTGGELKDISSSCITIKSQTTARIQEAHHFILHYICNEVDQYFSRHEH